MPDEKMVPVIFKGPAPEITVSPYGGHRLDEVKEYPEAFALNLIRTSKKLKFELVKKAPPAKAAAAKAAKAKKGE